MPSKNVGSGRSWPLPDLHGEREVRRTNLSVALPLPEARGSAFTILHQEVTGYELPSQSEWV